MDLAFNKQKDTEPDTNEPMVDFQSPPALGADTEALKPHW